MSEKTSVDDIIGLIKTDEHTNSVEEVRKLRGRETENLSKNILDLEEELAYYKSKCASLEEGIFNLERENEQLKTFLEALREELSLADRDNTALEKENEKLKSEINMLKNTIGRNEAYIKRLTEKGEWRISAYE